jgi:hypothetical protein
LLSIGKENRRIPCQLPVSREAKKTIQNVVLAAINIGDGEEVRINVVTLQDDRKSLPNDLDQS